LTNYILKWYNYAITGNTMLTKKEELLKEIQTINAEIQKRQIEIQKLQESGTKMIGALELLAEQDKLKETPKE
jgi:hypothetical protein